MEGYNAMLVVMTTDLSVAVEEYPLEKDYELNMTSIMRNAVKTIGSYEYFLKYRLVCIDFEPAEERIIVHWDKQ